MISLIVTVVDYALLQNKIGAFEMPSVLILKLVL